jgi:enamine deaminase RidA (YjgF/YER057c/UK114 family)
MALERVNPRTLPPAKGFSQIIRATGATTVYVSGQVAFDVDGEVVGVGDLKAQANQVFANAQAALTAAGATFDDVVKVTIYIVGYTPSMAAEIAPAYRTYVGNSNPTSTLVGVHSLALPTLLIEVEVTANLA